MFMLYAGAQRFIPFGVLFHMLITAYTGGQMLTTAGVD